MNRYLERVRIEGLSSLKSLTLRLESIEGCYFDNLNSLRNLTLLLKSKIDNTSLANLFEICSNIEQLYLGGQFSFMNLDSLFNLKKLTLYGKLLDDFDYDLFKSICNQLEYLSMELFNMNDKSIPKLLDGHHFSNLSKLSIFSSKITRLEKKHFDRFPTLNSLNISSNRKLKTIDKDAFSNLKSLKKLSLNFNNQLFELDPELFFGLSNLEILDLGYNKLRCFDLKIIDYIVSIKKIDLICNSIVNQEEIIKRCKQSEIELLVF